MPFNKPVHIVLAPNAFKNSLPAKEVASALATGLRQSGLAAAITSCPVGDGGDGTGKILALQLKARRQLYSTVDPLGRTIKAPVYYTTDETAIIELSDTAGLKLLKPKEYNPIAANTFGTGILIKKALARKVKRILLAIGGSASVDGGTGLLRALGVRFLNREGIELRDFPGALTYLRSIDITRLDPRIQQTELIVLCDVKNQLLGPKGAARVFGPQKGATNDDILLLEQLMVGLNKTIHKATGINMNKLPHSGAAGGVAASLAAVCSAQPVDGISYFLDLVQFDRQLQASDIVITGEGSLDAQSLEGKAPFGVAQRARKAGAKVIGVAGQIDTADKKLLKHFDHLININPYGISLSQAISHTKANLAKVGKDLGRLIAENGI